MGTAPSPPPPPNCDLCGWGLRTGGENKCMLHSIFLTHPNFTHTSIIHSHTQNMARPKKKKSPRCPKLTCVGAYMLVSSTTTVLAVGIAVRILRHVLVAVVLATLLARAELHYSDVLARRVIAVLAPQLSGGRRSTVFLALTRITLASVDSLYVLHRACVYSLCRYPQSRSSDVTTSHRTLYVHVPGRLRY